MHPVDASPYDALLLVSFGGPEQPADVVPFLENVTRGRGIPRERLEEVGEHYFLFGGRSPINDLNREFLAALREDLAGAGLDIPVYWGNRNWDPYLTDTVRQMRDDGITRAACLVTSAYSSYSSCRQYREDLAAATAAVEGAPRLDRLRLYWNHPGFIDSVTDAVLAALAELSGDDRDEADLIFVTHSIPTAMNDTSGADGGAYVRQHLMAMAEVATAVRAETGRRRPDHLAFCSRSGSPSTPWLEPDVNDLLRDLADNGRRSAVIIPLGFVSDHMEVIYDLDTEALATAEKVGMTAVRAATPGVDPRFVSAARDLLLERAAVERGETVTRAIVCGRAEPDLCAVNCCANLREPKPAIGQLG